MKANNTMEVPLKKVGLAVMGTYVKHIADYIVKACKDRGRDWAKQQAETLFDKGLNSGKIWQWGCVGIGGETPAFEADGYIVFTINQTIVK